MGKDEYWTKFDGEKILVSEMSEEHAKNALRMVLRREQNADETDSFKDAAVIGDTFDYWK